MSKDNQYEVKLRRFLEILEFQEVDEMMERPLEDVEQIVDVFARIMKTMSRRNDQLNEELKDSYDRKDMMEFAEYTARLYDLDGMTKWSDKGSEDKLDKTVNDILNEFEKEREIASQMKSSDIDGKDFTDILYGK